MLLSTCLPPKTKQTISFCPLISSIFLPPFRIRTSLYSYSVLHLNALLNFCQRQQESVKRYERERQSIRQLHQIRRAQIYSGPTWDVALFRKIVDQYGKQVGQGGQGDGTPHSTSTTNALTWEEYLKGKIFFSGVQFVIYQVILGHNYL